MPTRADCTSAIQKIDVKVDGDDDQVPLYLARWDRGGFYTQEQLKAFLLVIDARDAMRKVEDTAKWIESLQIQANVGKKPFSDASDTSKVRAILKIQVEHHSHVYKFFVFYVSSFGIVYVRFVHPFCLVGVRFVFMLSPCRTSTYVHFAP